jgi:hypothetical protein
VRHETQLAFTFVALAAGALVAITLGDASCKGHHDLLAPDDAAGGASSSSGKSAATVGAGGQGGSGPVEPDGPTRITFVNGTVDAPSVTFCFLPYPSGSLARAPFPQGGLAFGHAMVLSDASPDLPPGDALLLEIAGDVTPGTTCDDLAMDPAGYPELVITQIGVIPADALAMKKSFLFVTDGCVGGDPTHTGPNDKLVCGVGYSPATPNPGLGVLTMSRITNPERVGIQVVNAVAAVQKLDLLLQPSFTGSVPSMIAPGAPVGGALPYPPYFGLAVSDIGGAGGATLIGDVTMTPSMKATAALGDALAKGGLDTGAVANGKGIVLVAVGASPGVGAGPWWHDFTAVAVSADAP